MAIAILLFLPVGVSFWFNIQSHALGLSIACALLIAALSIKVRIELGLLGLLAMLAAIGFHLTIASLFGTLELERATLSLFLLAVILLTAFAISRWLFTLPDRDIGIAMSVLRVVMVFIGISSLLGIQPSAGIYWVKPIFPFTEPSHYALVFTPLLIDGCVNGKTIERYGWILVGYIMGYFLESLSLVVATTIAVAVSLPISRLIPATLVLMGAIGYVNIDYFTERLDFGVQTQNLSTLIYIQGWELVGDALQRTYGWGIGFQQLGYGPINSPAADAILRLTGIDLNLLDGGFEAAKIASEFGIFGLAFIAYFAGVATRAGILLRRVATGRMHVSRGNLLALSIVCGFVVDMFVRGVGYFSGTPVLFVAAWLYYRRIRREAFAADNSSAFGFPRLGPARLGLKARDAL